ALWQRIDRLLFLQPPGFEVVPDWRWQQEQALQARHPSRPGMTRAQGERFVQHYERVSRQALRTLPAIADRVVALDAERRPVGCGASPLAASRGTRATRQRRCARDGASAPRHRGTAAGSVTAATVTRQRR